MVLRFSSVRLCGWIISVCHLLLKEGVGTGMYACTVDGTQRYAGPFTCEDMCTYNEDEVQQLQ